MNQGGGGSGPKRKFDPDRYDPLAGTEKSLGHTDFHTYAQYDAIEDMAQTLDILDDKINPGSTDYSPEEVETGRRVLRTIQDVGRQSEKRNFYKNLKQANLSPEDLEVTERMLRSIAEENAPEEMGISESMDPDRAFMFQDDTEHAEAMADYVKALRSGEAVTKEEKASATGSKYQSLSPLEATSRDNGYTDLQTYIRYSEMTNIVDMLDVVDSSVNPETGECSPEEVQVARQVLSRIDTIGSEGESGDLYDNLQAAGFSEAELAVTERVMRSLADEDLDEMSISESMDPDREFMFQYDVDHVGAIADYISVIRTGKAVEKGNAGATGMSSAHADYIAMLADL